MKKNSIHGRRPAGSWRAPVVAAVAGVALLAACGGSHPSGSGADAGQMTRQQVDAYLQCMRGHGMTNFYLSRPRNTGLGGPIALGLMPYGVVLGVNFSSPQFRSASGACQHFLPGSAPPPLSSAQLRSLDKAAACMRTHGFPDWPDPDVQDGQLVPSPLPSGIDANSPQFQAAFKTCHPGP